MEDVLKLVPKEFRQVFEAIVALTDAFCERYLNQDYQELCQDMAIALCQKDSPVVHGRPASWASGIVHALGWVNCLQDPSIEPYMPSSEVAKGFGVSQGTMTAKSRIIRGGLGLMQLDPDWCLPAMLKDNPLVWMVEVNGLIMDMRMAPLELQQAAYDQDLIPFIPEPEEETEAPSSEGPKILKFPPRSNHSADPTQPKELAEDGPTLF